MAIPANLHHAVGHDLGESRVLPFAGFLSRAVDCVACRSLLNQIPFAAGASVPKPGQLKRPVAPPRFLLRRDVLHRDYFNRVREVSAIGNDGSYLLQTLPTNDRVWSRFAGTGRSAPGESNSGSECLTRVEIDRQQL